MMRTSLLRFAMMALVCGVAASGQTRPQPRYVISGTLVSSADGSAIPRGHVVATLVGRGRSAGRRFPSPDNSFDADGQGHFVMTLPSAGMWNLTADARGFSRQGYQEHEQYSTAVVLTSAEPTMDIRFVLSPEAEISGVVLDEAGEPVRNAQVTLVTVHPPQPDHSEPATTTRNVSQTDDRGEYEFDGLPAGNYRLSVQAQPWYAVAAGAGRGIPNNGSSDAASLDPPLDFTYALTWYPGVDDPNLAETLTLHAGDTSQADFHLLPIPSVHLLIDPPSNTTAPGSPREGMQFMPMIQRIGPGVAGFVPVSFNRNAQGQIDVGGLAPGLYQIQMAQPGQENHSDLVRVTGGAAQTVNLDAASDEARVTVHIDGLTDDEARSVQINLIDPETGSSAVPFNGGFGYRGGFQRAPGNAASNVAGIGAGRGNGPGNRSPRARDSARSDDRVIEAPPGRYEVVIQGRPDLYLTGISAKGAQATGRIVVLAAGDSSLTLHIADGRATLTGMASFKGKPSVGAMVMLVPATLGEPGSISMVRRDQSNSDGSFDLPEVIPGQYILIAVENGWGINWSDASTLRRYLTEGVPVDLASGRDVKLNVAAQAP